MPKVVDLTGTRVGILTVLERLWYIPEGWRMAATFYTCICDCGKVITVSSSNLVSCKTNKKLPRSCGCLQIVWLAELNAKIRTGEIKGPPIPRKPKYSERVKKEPKPRNPKHVRWQPLIVTKYYEYIKNAANRGYTFNLTEEEFKVLARKDCNYCGNPPQPKLGLLEGEPLFHGVDRVDNTIGYSVNNCVPCCGECNLAKSKLDVTEFLLKVKRIVEWQANQK